MLLHAASPRARRLERKTLRPGVPHLCHSVAGVVELPEPSHHKACFSCWLLARVRRHERKARPRFLLEVVVA